MRRYIVRSQEDCSRYCVWDKEKLTVATSAEGREYIDLDVKVAFRVTDNLNKGGTGSQ